MRDDILQQAVLAIAVSIDIKEEDYTKRVPAGTDLRQLEDPAFFVLSHELLTRFRHAWTKGISAERMGDGKGLPPLQNIYTSSRILSGLVHYVALELHWAVYHLPVELTTKMLEGAYHVIVHRFIHEDQGDMLTELASRKCIYEAIKEHLRISNTRTDARIMNMILHSNRPQVVFNMFKEYFREHSATAFHFEGSYIDFVMNAYKNYFYANHKADVWRALTADDSAKRELELDQHDVRYLDQGGTPADMYVHEHLINIREANKEVFIHTGQGNKVNGIMYDVYYLELCHLCEIYAKKVNEELYGFCVEFKDPYSRLEGKGTNKGIGAKISNAKQCLPMMFDYIREGHFNVSLLLDFRRDCFRRGRSSTQSTDPLWVSLGANNSGEAARYIDTEEGVINYSTFESIFKAVASTYNLMRALEERGRDLVTEYIKGRPDPLPDGSQLPFSDWFMKNSVVRYMDYLSSLDYLPLMRRLQAESDSAPKPRRRALSELQSEGGAMEWDSGEVDRNSGGLLDFEQMVYEYAGSADNFKTDIVAGQRYDKTHGLLDKPVLKGQGELSTVFKCKRSVFRYMTAIPYSYMEVDARRKSDYDERLSKASVQNFYLMREFPGVVLDYRGPADLNVKHTVYNRGDYMDYAVEQYKGIRYNSILARNQAYASQHVSSAVETGTMENLDWHIATSDFPCLIALSGDNAGPQRVGGATVQNWFARTYMHVPLLNTCITVYTSVAPGEDIQRAFWTEVRLDGESGWLLEYSGYRMPGCAPFTADLHAIALAARQYPDQQNMYVPAENIRAGYANARQRLENSLGFALYIGIDNLDKSEIEKGTLDNIEVYQDYTSQVQLYRQRLVELSWMQRDYVQLLQLMFTLCWCMSLPELTHNARDIQHARSLYNSLLTHIFKKDDLDWFFGLLRSSYYDRDNNLLPQYLWPHQMVDYSLNKSPDARREPITPRWALTIQGVLGSLVDDIGLQPHTKFEGGPYEQFLAKAQNWTEASERFILLHGFLYEKTLYIKLLRDAYTLTFGLLSETNNTLCCELNSVLKVMQVFDANDSQWVCNVADMRGMGDSIREFIREQVVRDNRDFSVLLSALSGHYEECAENLRTLVNYDVAVDEDLASKFDKWHDALMTVPPITNSEILNQIRGQYVCDANKYFYAGTDYFKSDYGGDTLYLHYSGHFLRATKDGQFEAFTLPTGTSQELFEYEQVLKKVIANVRYSDYE